MQYEAYRATINAFGRQVEVSFDGERLEINDVSIEEATAIAQALEGGGLAAVRELKIMENNG